jgi:hypothetical protein
VCVSVSAVKNDIETAVMVNFFRYVSNYHEYFQQEVLEYVLYSRLS